MTLSAALESLNRLLSVLTQKKIEYMIIGGYALPFYGRVRTTLDIDLAAAVEDTEKRRDLYKNLREHDFDVTFEAPIVTPLILVRDRKEGFEFEIWFRPDGIVFDEETLKRRRKVSMGFLSVWIVSPEDFIVNKLARPDRGAVDEQDVKSVLVRQGDRLDMRYLEKRAEKAGVLALLRTIMAKQ